MNPQLADIAFDSISRAKAIELLREQVGAVDALNARIKDLERRLAARERDLEALVSRWRSE